MLTRILDTYRAAFRDLEREVWILSLVSLVNRAGAMVHTFLVLYLTTQHEYAPAEAGVVLALYGVGGLVGVWLAGELMERAGFRAIMTGSLVLGGLGLFGLAFVDTRLGFALAVPLLALVTEAFRPANATAISVYTAPRNRTRAFGLHRLAINAGFTIGPAVGGVLAEIDYSWLFFADGVTCIAAAVVLHRMLPRAPREVPPKEEEKPAPRPGDSPWRDGLFLIVFAMLVLQGLTFFQLHSTFPLFLEEQRGLRESAIGALFAVNTVVIVLFEMVLLHAIRARDPMRVTGLGLLLVGVGFGLLPWVHAYGLVVLTVLLWTMGEMLAFPTLQAWVTNRASDRGRGRYLAAFALSFALTSILAPLLGTWLYQAAGPNLFWHVSALLGVVQFVVFRALSSRLRRQNLPSMGPA